MLCKQFRFDWKLFGKHDHSKRSSVHLQSPINVRIPIDFLHIFPLHSDRPDCDMFLLAFFLLTLIYISLRCIQLFFNSFGNVGTEILPIFTKRNKIAGSSFSSKWRLAPHCKMYCRCNLCGQ